MSSSKGDEEPLAGKKNRTGLKGFINEHQTETDRRREKVRVKIGVGGDKETQSLHLHVVLQNQNPGYLSFDIFP